MNVEGLPETIKKLHDDCCSHCKRIETTIKNKQADIKKLEDEIKDLEKQSLIGEGRKQVLEQLINGA